MGRRGRRGVAIEREASAVAEIVCVKLNQATVPPSRADAIGWTVVAILMAAYAAVFSWLSLFSLQDYPNHLARAVAMADLMFHDGLRFGALFQYHFAIVPNILPDLFVAGAVELLGLREASALWIGLVVLSLPLALLFYLRGTRIPVRGQILILLLSLYLSTDGFFFQGFLTFRLAVALTLVCLALVQQLRRRWSPAIFATFCAVIVLGYLIHLAMVVFVVVAIAASAPLALWWRSTSIRKEVYFLIPIVVVGVWQYAVAGKGHVPGDLQFSKLDWGTWYSKIQHLWWPFSRYYGTRLGGRVDKLLLLAFAVCALWPLRQRLHRAAFMQPAVLEMLFLAVAFLGMYIVSPSTYGEASFLDLRALALVPLFVSLACLLLPDAKSSANQASARPAIVLATLLVLCNLAYLSWHLVKDNAWMAQYRAIIAAVPKSARVLPLYPGNDELNPFMHAASFVVIDREALIPYLFSGNRGNPQTYFRYIHFPYAPSNTWYFPSDPPVSDADWQAVACAYDFLLVTKPLDLRRVHVATTPVVENASASLLAVTKTPCANT